MDHVQLQVTRCLWTYLEGRKEKVLITHMIESLSAAAAKGQQVPKRRWAAAANVLFRRRFTKNKWMTGDRASLCYCVRVQRKMRNGLRIRPLTYLLTLAFLTSIVFSATGQL
jgi:hypothetical protein